MNKKYLSVVLFGALLAASAGTFTSCKDYDDDIKGLQEQIDKSGSTITDLQTQLTTLKAAAEAAQATADAAKAAAVEAKTAADAAKAAGDQAKADAADALAKAKAAEAAAATAKTEAIAEATKLVEALRNSMQEAIDKKLDVTAFEEASKLLGARIDGIEAGLSTLENGAVKENTEAIKTAMDLIETLQTADANFATTLKELDEYVKITLEAKIDANAEDIKAAQDDIKAAQDDLAALWKEIDGKGGLKDLIGANKTAISDLETKIADELETIKGDVKDIQDAIKVINGQITAINKNLTGLHTLVTCRLTSISFAPDLFVDGIEAVRFTSLQYSPMDVKDENASIPAKSYQFSTAALATASYHFNPASFKLANADYGYIDRTAEVVETTRAIAASKLVEIVGEPVANPATGTVDFQLLRLNSHTTQPELDRTNLIALQATLKGDAIDQDEKNAVVTSPYVAVYDNILAAEDVRIADKETLFEGGNAAHYATTFDACTKTIARYKMDYDKVFNLKELVATCFGTNVEGATTGHNEFPVEAYNLSYRFAVASSKYNITEGSTVTDQQPWIVCNDAEAGLFQAEGFNKEAIGRTPILKVELVDANGNVVRRGFVKVEVGVSKSSDMVLDYDVQNLVAKCRDTKTTYTISEEFMRENVYRVITNGKETSMSHEEFWNLYDASSATTTIHKNSDPFVMSAPQIIDGKTEVGTATKKVVWSFAHGELGKIGSSSSFIATITVKNKLASSEYPANITFRFTVNVTLPKLSLDAKEKDVLWVKNEDGTYKWFPVNAVLPSGAQDYDADKCQFVQNVKLAYEKYNVKGLPGCESDRYQVIKTFSNGVATPTPMSGVKIENYSNITLDKTADNVKTALNSPAGLQAVVAHIYKLANGDEITVNTFMVNFIRPVNLNLPSGVTVTDALDNGDVADFQWNGLLTDWRNNAIVKDGWAANNQVNSYWKQNCTTDYQPISYYKRVQDAKFEVKHETVSFVLGSGETTTMYTASETYTLYKLEKQGEGWDAPFQWTEKETLTFTSAKSISPADAKADIYGQLLAKGWTNDVVTSVEQQGETTYAKEVVVEGLVEYTYISDIKYTPAVYELVVEYRPVIHTHTDMPTYAGANYGQTDGCWVWTKDEWPVWEMAQYWYYYGPIGDIKADVNKATTSLSDKKLPANASLKQEGNTVKYVNVLSPVQYAFDIYIPVSVNYGWGTLTSTLTIKVNPNPGLNK